MQRPPRPVSTYLTRSPDLRPKDVHRAPPSSSIQQKPHAPGQRARPNTGYDSGIQASSTKKETKPGRRGAQRRAVGPRGILTQKRQHANRNGRQEWERGSGGRGWGTRVGVGAEGSGVGGNATCGMGWTDNRGRDRLRASERQICYYYYERRCAMCDAKKKPQTQTPNERKTPREEERTTRACGGSASGTSVAARRWRRRRGRAAGRSRGRRRRT